MTNRHSRRDFLKSSTLAAAAGSMPYWFTTPSARAYFSSTERPVVGCIGTGDRWQAVGPQALNFGEGAAVCDVDADHAGKARERVKEIQEKRGQGVEVAVYEDYRKVLDRSDIDVVTIVTPDHWHSKIAIEALQAGKDVYCEKPLTLTIHEGKQIRKVLRDTGRVFQVGTQQRSEMGQRFLQAVALVREGRIGEVKSVQCAIGGAPSSGPIPKADPPPHLNWEMWLGQAPLVDYRFKETGSKYGNSRCHYEFRWWYEYSGGKMTDWGAHHVDIAQWAIGQNGEDQGPVKIIPVSHKHPVPYERGYPTLDDQYNAATEFFVRCLFPNGVEMIIRHDTDNGILFEGTEGRFFVNRGKITGAPVEALQDQPLPEDALVKVYKGKEPTDHMRNFFDCVKSRQEPISDVPSHHRAMTTCHLANIAIRLNRELTWDPKTEQIVGDEEARSFQAREQRKGYEINVSV